MKLNVIFQTQRGNETKTSGHNDCGAACVGMVAGHTVEQVLADIHQPGNEPLHIQTVMSALRHYFIPNEHVRPLTLEKLRELLSQRMPVIALVRYGRLPASLKADPTFDDNHFVTVVGYTASGFLVHDPLWQTAEHGAYVEWPDAVMDEALKYVKALPYQGVLVRRSWEIGEADLFEDAVVAVRDRMTAANYLEMLYNALGTPPGQADERQGHAVAQIASLMALKRSVADGKDQA